jgi:hypothetical protein
VVSGADSLVIPLVDPADPVLIGSARLEFEDDLRPVMIISLENQTGSVINTNEIWLDTLRFYTKGEMARAERKMIWDCGLGTAAARGQESRPIPPHERIELRVPFATSNCQHNRDHEHFAVAVSRIGRRFSEPTWKRESGEFSRLLAAAQPHP